MTVFRPEEEASGFLAAIVESSDDAIIGKDLNGVILTWNRGAERLLG
jgi:PAS domain S-box-containing protein